MSRLKEIDSFDTNKSTLQLASMRNHRRMCRKLQAHDTRRRSWQGEISNEIDDL